MSSLWSWLWQQSCLEQDWNELNCCLSSLLQSPAEISLETPGAAETSREEGSIGQNWVRVIAPIFHLLGNGRRGNVSSPRLCYLSSQTSRTQLPTLGIFSFCQRFSKSPVVSGFLLDLWWPCLYWTKWLCNTLAALTRLRHFSTAVSFSIYFLRFLLHGGTGLLLSCWLLWKAMCCKYSILLS